MNKTIEIAGIIYTLDRTEKPLPDYVRGGRGYKTIVSFAPFEIYKNGDKEISIIPDTRRSIESEK